MIDSLSTQRKRNISENSEHRIVFEIIEVSMLIFHVVLAYDFWKQRKKMDQVINEVRQLENVLLQSGLSIDSFTVETLNGPKRPEQINQSDLGLG